MSSAPLSEEVVDRINEEHTVYLRKLLQAQLSGDADVSVQSVEPPENLQEYLQEVRQRRVNRFSNFGLSQERIGDLLNLPDGIQRSSIGIDAIMASADAQHNAVLQKPWFVKETSNRERAFAKYAHDLMPSLLLSVPVRCKDFYLLPEQRLAILVCITPLPVDVYVNCEIPRDAMDEITARGSRKMPFSVRYRLEKNKLPTFSVADYCTGSGKTVMAITAALSLLCCDRRWKGLKSSFKGLLEDRTREEYSGLCKIDNTEKARLARLAIMFVPATTLSHWYKTAQSAVFGVKECFGPSTDVLVWRGFGGRDQNMQEALDCGRPVLWVLPMESDSMQAVRRSPNIHYAVRIFDELNVPMRSRYDQPESTALYNYITQATIEALEGSTAGNPRAPLRQAFNGNFAPICRAAESIMHQEYKAVQEMLTHYCKMLVFASPKFVRTSVSSAVQSKMPRGIVVHRVRMRTATLAAMATGSDMIKMSLSDLAGRLLGPGVDKGVRDRIKTLFDSVEVVCSDALMKELNEAHDALPLLTMSDNAAKSAVKRLIDRMTELFGGTMPNCPITLEPIPRERVRILPCCTAILDSEGLKGWLAAGKHSCPLCRAPIGAVAEVKPEAKPEPAPEGQPEGAASSSNAAGKRPMSNASASNAPKLKQQKLERGGSPSLQPDDSDEEQELPVPMPPPPSAVEVLENKLAEIDASIPSSVDGVIQVMKAQVELEPTSRMLLCFGFEITQRAVVRQIQARIEHEIEGVSVLDVETCVKDYMKMDSAMVKFNNRVKTPSPQVFLINTTSTSSSVQGLDLHETDVTIIVSNCTLATQRQAVGRSLRMRPVPAAAGEDFKFPSKRIVVASLFA